MQRKAKERESKAEKREKSGEKNGQKLGIFFDRNIRARNEKTISAKNC